MSGKIKFIISLILITIFFMLFIFFNSYRLYTDTAKKSTSVLMTQYYQLVNKHPNAAKRALDLILASEPNNHDALRELGFWYLRQGDVKSARNVFALAQHIYPNDNTISQQLAQLNRVFQTTPTIIASQAKVAPFTPQTVPVSKVAASSTSNQPISTISVHDQLLNQFYLNRKTNPALAWQGINKLLLLYPHDLIALKEAGYYALGQGKKEQSLVYFIHAYELSHDPYLAMQTAYIFNSLNQNRKAYHYFQLATKTSDLNARLKAELALTNLRGVQTKLLPDRFFVDLMLDPFYQSRFKLMIYPIIARAGYVLSPEYGISAYLSYRRTQDNKSSVANQLPQIYEDDVAVTGVGLSAAPFKTFPIVAFMEAGKAVDLIYRNRSRWRNDFRGGFAYYNEWGRNSRYTFKHAMPLAFNADLYADYIYYSRYINTIATLRARPAIEIWRFGASSLNVYWKVFASEDKNRLFYNNIIETGPAIAFTPSDRYNITFRYENLKGYYLPSGSPQPNPYSSTYHNNYVVMDIFIGI